MDVVSVSLSSIQVQTVPATMHTTVTKNAIQNNDAKNNRSHSLADAIARLKLR